MSHDQSRVNSLQKRLRFNSNGNGLKGSKATLPANSGDLIGSPNYIVTLGFGTPKKDLTLVFDTGSDITWIQCQPCPRGPTFSAEVKKKKKKETTQCIPSLSPPSSSSSSYLHPPPPPTPAVLSNNPVVLLPPRQHLLFVTAAAVVLLAAIALFFYLCHRRPQNSYDSKSTTTRSDNTNRVDSRPNGLPRPTGRSPPTSSEFLYVGTIVDSHGGVNPLLAPIKGGVRRWRERSEEEGQRFGRRKGNGDTNTCIYGVQYGDQSYTVGFFTTETLTLIPSDVFPNFAFGCGLKNVGLFQGAAGLLGLGRNALSLVGQTASKYGKYFSYCLPTLSSSGTLAFGKEGGPTNSASLKYTQLLTKSNGPSFYFIEVLAIKVGGQPLSISPSVFSNSGTIIDSGTVVTRLQPEAYSALRTSFRQQMMNYTMTKGVSLFDTCYDFSGHDTVVFPEITFVFGGNVEVPIDPSGILFGTSQTQACLAFAGNKDASDVGIFGNLQQQTLDVVYDVTGGKLGFGTRGCS
ncbi:hypothetical protein Vadar_027549 [Vaccinium darrowii]|uniref:Uncharacterized protein n=1 Tax=Vaccinium darrowii TaxID=229202 RepID=A0ACB7XKR0_9ERIC|nr:hypothetical protein Vadar_027549 [Vaccinium darrowii]